MTDWQTSSGRKVDWEKVAAVYSNCPRIKPLPNWQNSKYKCTVYIPKQCRIGFVV